MKKLFELKNDKYKTVAYSGGLIVTHLCTMCSARSSVGSLRRLHTHIYKLSCANFVCFPIITVSIITISSFQQETYICPLNEPLLNALFEH